MLKTMREKDPDFELVWNFRLKHDLSPYGNVTRKITDDSFRPEHWEQFRKLIEQNPKILVKLSYIIFGKTVSNETIYMLLTLYTRTCPEKMRAYLRVHIKVCYLKEILLYNNSFHKYMGLSGSDKTDFLHNAKGILKPFINMVKEVANEYWNMDDGFFKVRILKGRVTTIKYKGKVCALQGAKNDKFKQWNMTLETFAKLKSLVYDVYHNNATTNEVRKRYGIDGRSLIKVYSIFNPTQLLKECRAITWDIIKNNMPLISINQVLLFIDNVYTTKGDGSVKLIKVLDTEVYDKITGLMVKMVNVQKRLIRYINFKMLSSRQPSIVLTFLHFGSVRSSQITCSFSHLPLYLEFTEYLYASLRGNSQFDKSIISLKNFFDYLAVTQYPTKPRLCVANIKTADVTNYLSHLDLSRVAYDCLREIRKCIKFLSKLRETHIIPKMGILPPPPKGDVTSNLSVKKGKEKSYQPLPEEVYVSIMYYIDELDISFKNAFIISSSAGLRPNELEYITVDSMKEEGGKNVLNIWQSKVEEAHGKRGKEPIRKVPITDPEVVKAFYEQVEISKKIRSVSGMESIFTIKAALNKQHDARFSIISPAQLNKMINNLIKKYNICSDNGVVWQYSAYQLRVMMVVDMIENGATDKEVRAFFGWLSETTIKKAYAMVKKLKMMDMNSEFFNSEFGVNLQQNALDKYTEEDLQLLCAEFYIHRRDMGYGQCLRHPIQGECGKLQDAVSCAPCSKLILAPSNRTAWEKLYHNQYRIVADLRRFYEEREVSEERYKQYAYYIHEVGILESYADLLMKIDKPVKVVKWYE